MLAGYLGKVIFIGLGSNLVSERYGSPQLSCQTALKELERHNITVVALSRWFRSAPVPPSDQPWFVNAVAAIRTTLDPEALLERLHEVEATFGRLRREKNEARVLDLDLLAYHDTVADGPQGPILPHPRMHERAFVLLPLADIAPNWRHPRLGAALERLVAALPPDQIAEPIVE